MKREVYLVIKLGKSMPASSLKTITEIGIFITFASQERPHFSRTDLKEREVKGIERPSGSERFHSSLHNGGHLYQRGKCQAAVVPRQPSLVAQIGHLMQM
jgi:hypothetical protein